MNFLRDSKERLKKIDCKTTIKGSFRDPLFYLKITTVVLLVSLPFQISSTLKSLGPQEDFSLLPTFFQPSCSGQSMESIAQSEGCVLDSQNQIFSLETPPLTIVQNASLQAYSSPMNISAKVLGSRGNGFETEKEEITRYLVQSGDTLSSIADQFNVSLNTILWANGLSLGATINPGQTIIVLPISGVLHLVGPGDTLGQVVQLYKGDPEEVIAFNNISDEGKIYIGDFLIIPDGKMPAKKPVSPSAPLANYYFICPIPSPCNITQGLHPYNAIDFSNGRCGDPIYAAAGGVVQKTGYQSIAGKYIRIIHPNGVVTFYGHLSKTLVSPGEKVLQGQIIGYMGYTGYTIPAGPRGCHLHFEVRGATNPFR